MNFRERAVAWYQLHVHCDEFDRFDWEAVDELEKLLQSAWDEGHAYED